MANHFLVYFVHHSLLQAEKEKGKKEGKVVFMLILMCFCTMYYNLYTVIINLKNQAIRTNLKIIRKASLSKAKYDALINW